MSNCLANLSCLTGKERDELRKVTTRAGLTKSHAAKRLLQFVRAEKAYFLDEIVVADLRKVLVVRPKQTNPRIIAQQGAFLLFGLTSELQADNMEKIGVSEVRIPAASKAAILRELDRVNINRASLFPEVESAAKYIMSKLVPVEGGAEKAKPDPKARRTPLRLPSTKKSN